MRSHPNSTVRIRRTNLRRCPTLLHHFHFDILLVQKATQMAKSWTCKRRGKYWRPPCSLRYSRLIEMKNVRKRLLPLPCTPVFLAALPRRLEPAWRRNLRSNESLLCDSIDAIWLRTHHVLWIRLCKPLCSSFCWEFGVVAQFAAHNCCLYFTNS